MQSFVPQFLSVLLLKAFQLARHFSSLVLLSSTQTFLLARVQHFLPLSQSKFIPLEYCDVDYEKDKKDRI